MKQYIRSVTLAGMLALAVSAAAQTPPPSAPPTAQPPAASATGTVTVEGCLMREDDVPGRKANVAERVGVGEDFILTSTRIIKGAAPGGAAGRPDDTPVGTSGAGAAMYDVEGLDNDQLKPHLGRRVQVDGTFENVNRAGGKPGDALVELRGTAIRSVSGECPPKP